MLLYKPGTYNIKNAGTTVQLKVETAYPKTGTVAITVASPQRTQFPLALHVPSWCDDFEAVVHEQRYQGRSGSLLIIDRTWQPGDQVKIHMDMSFKVLDGGESYPDKMALQRGPQVLATDSTVSDNGGKLPSREWFGDQLYPIRGVTPGGMEQKLAMVPFAEAGQAWGDYEVWINKLTLSRNTRQLDPVGKVHIPIGIPNSLDSLKTFVEAEGNFSPGIGSYGIYFWVFDPARDRLTAPTSEEVQCTHGLVEDRLLIPWSQWSTGAVDVRTDVCAVKRVHAQGDVYLVGARAHLTNTGDQPKRVSLYVALRPLGPAGFDVQKLTVGSEGDALLADGHSALVANTRPSAAGVLPTDTIGNMALRGGIPKAQSSASEKGDCSGALRFELEIPAGRTETVELVCPVHPGRRAVRHQWTPRTTNYVDIAVPHSNADGIDIPDLGLDCYHGITAGDLFQQARDDWHRFYSRVALDLPEARWTNGFYVMLAHAGLCMNEGAADVAVLNYTVFNRDGMYIANMMQKAGLPRMSEAVIDYFLAHPFNGRPYPEADNPGQVLWSMGQHWKLTGDRIWLQGIYPSAKKIAEMIKYYRNTQGPYWVNLDSLEYGEALSQDERLELKPGRCDGFHPEYTEAFDIAGLRVVGDLAEAMGQAQEAQQWRQLADRFMKEYDRRFSKNLGKSYGSYSVLWPCQLYPLDEGKAHDQFKGIGARELVTWRYFAPATAHQGLLAGNRQAGYGTVDLHLDHPQMRHWYAFDEGGKSGSGGWHHLRTTWTHSKTEPDKNRAVAMPHGWAIAEVWLLMRDCLVYEQNDRLVLLAGLSPEWFRDPQGMTIQNLPTYFGKLDLRWQNTTRGGILTLGGARPPQGFILSLPPTLRARLTMNNEPITENVTGRYALPMETKSVQIDFK